MKFNNILKVALIILTLVLTGFRSESKKTVYGGGLPIYKSGVKLSGNDHVGGQAHSQFGWSVSMSGEFAAVSAPMEPIDSVEVGAVYIYRKLESGWKFFQKIIPGKPEFLQRFGATVSIRNSTLMISSPGLYDKSGSVFVYQFNGYLWEYKQELRPHQHVFFQHFGASIEQGDGLVLINTVTTAGQYYTTGTVYIFRNQSGNWIQDAEIKSPGKIEDDLFGSAVKIISPTQIVVSAPRGSGKVDEAGIVYSYIKTDNGWKVDQIIEPENGRAKGLFGCSVDYCNGKMIIGYMEALVDSVYAGEAHLYSLQESGYWSHECRFVPEVPTHHDYFGADVSIGKNFIVIGSPKWDLTKKDSDHGTAYVFYNNADTWEKVGQIIPDDLEENDHFGLTMSMDGDNLVIGNSLDDNPDMNNGSASFYDLNTLLTSVSDKKLPLLFSLEQNFPNPFNNSTIIYYNLPVTTEVVLSVFNLLGQEVTNLVRRTEIAGNRQVAWNGKDSSGKPVPPGIYIYKIETKEFNDSKQMIFLK